MLLSEKRIKNLIYGNYKPKMFCFLIFTNAIFSCSCFASTHDASSQCLLRQARLWEAFLLAKCKLLLVLRAANYTQF